MAEEIPVETLSFEAALKELEAIVSRLETGDASLEESIRLYQRGSALRARCSDRLDAAQAQIDAIRLDTEGRPAGTVPFTAG
jgi:exodeoxyribonuclease VII small subunit